MQRRGERPVPADDAPGPPPEKVLPPLPRNGSCGQDSRPRRKHRRLGTDRHKHRGVTTDRCRCLGSDPALEVLLSLFAGSWYRCC
ncbi:hypothetical protein HPB50_003826 [Hyalomma asiaticum]|uniref:Uncharacterized protein n=1 Tax=Hyalomma asiaticum TaxID=266040 RepID=A0ACB7TBL9_HYAAI|nr:hypothetical protein HPB50_003826 [Hyalomma asiaticum]